MTASHWLLNVGAWTAQVAAMIGAATAAAWLFRLRVPRIRLVYWQALLGICLLLPAVEPWRDGKDANITIASGPARSAPAQRVPANALPWRQGLVLLLISGAGARLCWLMAGLWKLRRWRRIACALAPLPRHLALLRSGIAPRAELCLSPSVTGPVTFGLLRPVVLMPERFTDFSAEIQEAIACHELLHVRRGDWLATVIEQAIGAALWFHPAIWWAIAQIQLAREQTVDAAVLAVIRNREPYLNALLAIAGHRRSLDLAPAALFLRKGHLKKRVGLLLEEVSMSKRKLVSFCAASCTTLFAVGWLALHLFPLQAAPVPQDSAQPNLLHSVAPKYPPAAREKHIEGDVVLEVQIDENGRVSDARVLSGPTELRAAALEAVLQWHYSSRSMTLPATTRVTVGFTLAKDDATAAPPSDLLPAGKRVTLQTIVVDGLNPGAREQLLRSLPVQQGQTADADTLRELTAAVKTFDEHLRVAVGMIDDNSARVQIFLPGSDKIRVGGNIQQTKLLNRVVPVYPPEAKAKHLEGIVRLQATIGSDGTVENLEVLSGDPLLAAAAIEAVKQWKYQTTLLNGNPVEVVTEIQVNFTLSQ